MICCPHTFLIVMIYLYHYYHGLTANGLFFQTDVVPSTSNDLFTDFLAGVTYESKGCYKDQEARAISSLEGKDVLLSDSYTEREDAIQKCAVAAIIRGYKTFGIQNGGMCVSGPDAHQTYSKYGESMDCKNDGEGGPWANQVYNLVGRVDGKLT